MNVADPTCIRALVFDVFGTVVDWRGGVAGEVARVAESRDVAIDGGGNLNTAGAVTFTNTARHSSRRRRRK